MTAGTDRVRDDAERRGIPIEIVERAPATSLEHAAELLGITPAEIVKSLVVKRSDGSYLFALVPGDRQISWPKLRAVVGVNKLRMPEASLALEATGFARGTITPLGSSTAWPVYADERIAGKRVSMGSGDHGYTAWVHTDDLITGLEATVADITSETGTD
ncbi:aminoacyl-tRNA deacylase [Salinibacterium sp. SWN248]|uniref:aminoacyl-tRNA deacylase n=1 Tax=Salinibacterium sp. SWN248 TaxID=2792056 RepID=UPI0018CD86DF|nr:YbaK/EbsC family protein [Salinibacterium sp. SWN248]MBH0023964.1 YbaK/EbsC family protein [Salinibacterium sp. SWN248]